MVAPVISRAEEDGYARVKAWLPQGVWTDIFTGDEYAVSAGGKEITLYRNLESIPVLIKSGGILPLSKDKGNGCSNPCRLEIWAYIGNGKYTLYEDGNEVGLEGEARTEICSVFSKSKGAGTQSLTIFGQGDSAVIPQNREISVRFKNIEDGEIKLFIDGKEIRAEKWLTDCAGIKFPFEMGKTYRIEVEFLLKSKIEKLKERAVKELTFGQGNNAEKQKAYLALKKAKSATDFKRILDGVRIPNIVKQRILETK